MRTALAAITISVAFLLAGISVPVIAHGDKPHAEQEQSADPVEPSTAGAPSVSNEVVDLETPAVAMESSAVGTVLGNLHPATVHFPIALLIAAALTEAFLVFRPGSNLQPAVSAMTVLGAGGAVLAAGFGWYHTGFWLGGESTMVWHRWIGTAIAGFSLVAAWLALGNHGGSRGALRLLLALICLAMLPQAYLGAELAHGENHLFASH